MLVTASQPVFEQMVERIRRAGRSLRVRDEQSERRRLVGAIPRKRSLDKVIDERLGYGILPVGMLDTMGPAIRFAQEIREERRSSPICSALEVLWEGVLTVMVRVPGWATSSLLR